MRTIQNEIQRLREFIQWDDADAYMPQGVLAQFKADAGCPNVSGGVDREAWRYSLSNNERLRVYGLDFNESALPHMRSVKASMVHEVPSSGMTRSEYEAWWVQSESDEHRAEPAYRVAVAA